MSKPGTYGWLRAAALTACLLAVLPIIAARHLPLLDAQGHESRLVALRDILLLDHGSPFYAFTGFFLPNVAFDVVGLALIGVTGPELAGQIFFGLTLILTLSGVMVLNRIVIGRWSLVPLMATLLLYNLITILGFFSYAFGFALVLWALAGWRLLLTAPPAPQALFTAAAGLILLFCHVFDFGIFALMVGGFALTDLLTGRANLQRTAIAMLAIVPALAAYGFMARIPGGQLQFERHLLTAKLFGLAKSVTCASFTGDVAFAAGALLFLLLLAVSRRPRLAAGFAMGIAGLAVMYFLLPDKLASGSYVDKRMPIAIALLVLAGLDVQIRRSRASVALIGLICLAVAGKQVALAVLWRSFDPVIDDMARSLDALPPGSIILQAECEPDSAKVLSVYRERQPSLTHMPAMAAFSDSRFVAATWAIAGQHTVAVKPAYRDYYDLQQSFGSSTCDADGYRTHYAEIAALKHRREPLASAQVYFLLIRPATPDPLSGEASPVASAPSFVLYRVD